MSKSDAVSFQRLWFITTPAAHANGDGQNGVLAFTLRAADYEDCAVGVPFNAGLDFYKFTHGKGAFDIK